MTPEDQVKAIIRQGYARDENLSNLPLAEANLSGLIFERCKFLGTDMQGAFLKGVQFIDCDLASANLTGAYARKAWIAGSSFKNANLSSVDMRNSHIGVLKSGEPQSVACDFTNAKLVNLILAGSKVASSTLWPKGFDLEQADFNLID